VGSQGSYLDAFAGIISDTFFEYLWARHQEEVQVFGKGRKTKGSRFCWQYHSSSTKGTTTKLHKWSWKCSF